MGEASRPSISNEPVNRQLVPVPEEWIFHDLFWGETLESEGEDSDESE